MIDGWYVSLRRQDNPALPWKASGIRDSIEEHGEGLDQAMALKHFAEDAAIDQVWVLRAFGF
jgi:hypothetical protein